MKEKESDLVKSCLEWLAYKKIWAWRNNSGAFKTERGGFYRMGLLGSADIFAILPPNGTFVGIECKTGKNKLSLAQFEFGEKLMKAGGRYLVIRSLEDLEKELKNN